MSAHRAHYTGTGNNTSSPIDLTDDPEEPVKTEVGHHNGRLAPGIKVEPDQQAPIDEGDGGSAETNGSGRRRGHQNPRRSGHSPPSTSQAELDKEEGSDDDLTKLDSESESDSWSQNTPERPATRSTAGQRKRKRVSHSPPSSDDESGPEKARPRLNFESWPQGAERKDIHQNLMRQEFEPAWTDFLTNNKPGDLDPLPLLDLVLPHPLIRQVIDDEWPATPIDARYRHYLGAIRKLAVSLFKDLKHKTWNVKVGDLRRSIRFLSEPFALRTPPCAPCVRRNQPCVDNRGARSCQFCTMFHNNIGCDEESAARERHRWREAKRKTQSANNGRPKKSNTGREKKTTAKEDPGILSQRHSTSRPSSRSQRVASEPAPFEPNDPGMLEHLEPDAGLAPPAPAPSISTRPSPPPPPTLDNNPSTRRPSLNLGRLLDNLREHVENDPDDQRKKQGDLVLDALEDDLATGTVLGTANDPALSDLRRHLVHREPTEERKEWATFLIKRFEVVARSSGAV
ncbi:hypothetical protein Q8F55_004646 [Vanrija albida]|uniref:Zn(2)-C6 fungal-type domain-containing protein n=1 Tax=Vanrija albida TaxID=181172 RepID=A0ABR3Q7C8_9TREE